MIRSIRTNFPPVVTALTEKEMLLQGFPCRGTGIAVVSNARTYRGTRRSEHAVPVRRTGEVRIRGTDSARIGVKLG